MDLVRGWRIVAVLLVTALLGAYVIGHLISRSGIASPGPEVPSHAGAPAAPAEPTAAEPTAAEPTQPALAEPAVQDAAAIGAGGSGPTAARQPFTGPGRPPLPRSPTGPSGSRRTTGAEYVALTFDDGPDPRFTPEVLALLREHDVKATFCVVGQLAEAYPDLIRDIAADGHTLCNHSWDHDIGLGSRSVSEIRQNLTRTNQAIQAAAPGVRVSYYRQPGGAWTDRVVDVAEELGMSSLHWTVDPQDWALPGADVITAVVTQGTIDGAIVLLHDGGGERQGTVTALRRFLPVLATRHQLDALPPGIDLPRRHGVELPLNPGQI